MRDRFVLRNDTGVLLSVRAGGDVVDLAPGASMDLAEGPGGASWGRKRDGAPAAPLEVTEHAGGRVWVLQPPRRGAAKAADDPRASVPPRSPPVSYACH